MTKRKVTNKFLYFLILLWIFAAGAKSLIHLKRTVAETISFIHSPNLIKNHFPQIKPCQPKPANLSEEESHLWEYRNMGARCEN
ncbi:hypothetical protein C4578_00025 [Candidatus Microgenomates bacterium]|nr:MAG: hypothetical protein C4578_00025 [Candidatus Microgenomates bacterium]